MEKDDSVDPIPSSTIEDEDAVNLLKRPKLSLSLTKRRLEQARFRKPVGDKELIEASRGVIPKNTKRRNNWASKNFLDWLKNRNEKVPNDPVPEDLFNCQDPAVVNKWLCRYVLETRQQDGKPYPPKSLYGLLCGIQRIFHDNKVPFTFLDKSDVRFKELHGTLDTVCSELHSIGIGAEVNSALIISYEHEDLFWTAGALGYDNPRALFYSVFFYTGLSFCLRGGQEQRDLSWKNFRRFPDDCSVYNGDTYYEYIEFVSKNNQHRFRDIHLRNKCVKAYANCGSEKCVVKILDFYKTKIPADTKAFYIRPLQKVPADPNKSWFSNVPVGGNTLNTVMNEISEIVKDDSIPKYTNHSLRATAASRLFEKGVPEKIIAERTGHRSMAG
jgi:hypothetical protein